MTSAALPTDPAARIAAMDAARGLAVCGIVLLNVYNFSMPPAAYFSPLSYGQAGMVGLAIWALESILAQDTFRAVFAMLFGAGVAILFERGGRHPMRAHVARMAVLLAIGWAHAVLLNNGDVLRLYALTGLLLPPFLRLGSAACWSLWACWGQCIAWRSAGSRGTGSPIGGMCAPGLAIPGR